MGFDKSRGVVDQELLFVLDAASVGRHVVPEFSLAQSLLGQFVHQVEDGALEDLGVFLVVDPLLLLLIELLAVETVQFEVVDCTQIVQNTSTEDSGSNGEDFRFRVGLVVDGVLLGLDQILRREEHVLMSLLADHLGEASSLSRDRVNVSNFHLSLVIDEDVVGVNVSEAAAVGLEVVLGSNEGVEQVPEFGLLEVGLLDCSFLDFVGEDYWIVRVEVLSGERNTMAVPVLLQSSLPCW